MTRLSMADRESLEAHARAFHESNPQVYAKLREFALEVRRSGLRHFSIGALWERLRYHAAVETQGDKYRLNNNHRAFYARLLMEREPELRNFFTTRTEAHDPDFHQRQERDASRV